MVVTIATILVLAIGCVQGDYNRKPTCYQHYDHTSKYQLSHQKGYYPSREINLILQEHPDMKLMFEADDHPQPEPPSHYSPAPQTSCPYHRYTLYSFFYEGKDCYVIYPEVQKASYVQCGAGLNRDCQQCATYRGVNKCDEDYEYRHVWAYCIHRQPVTEKVVTHRPTTAKPRPHKYTYAPRVDPQTRRPNPPDPHRPHKDTNTYFPRTYNRYPYYPIQRVYQSNDGSSSSSSGGRGYLDPWRTLYRPMLQQRWKRSYHRKHVEGMIERKRLYLPHHCGCKRFIC